MFAFLKYHIVLREQRPRKQAQARELCRTGPKPGTSTGEGLSWQPPSGQAVDFYQQGPESVTSARAGPGQ